jgi:hypothetical protein
MTTTFITKSKVAGVVTAIALTALPAAPAMANRNWYPAKHTHHHHTAKPVAHAAGRNWY